MHIPTSTSYTNKTLFTICKDFWFSDGNIILKTASTLFKVHRGQLTRHSEVFESLFMVPQPLAAAAAAGADAFADGLQYVELHDSPSDMFYFLRALYDGLYFKHPPGDDFPSLSAVLRLSSKYFVEHLRIRCIHRLENDWPSTLAGWDKREIDATAESGHYSPRDLYAHPVLLIELAMELELPGFLASAFYDLSRYGPSKVVIGTVTPLVEYPLQPQHEEEPRILTNEILVRILRGREQSQSFMIKYIKAIWNRAPSKDCLTPNSADADESNPCLDSFYFIALNLLRSVGGVASGRDADPLYTLIQAMDMLSRTDFSDGERNQKCGLKICGVCKGEFEEACKETRRLVWRLIPFWFGLRGEENDGDGVAEDEYY